MSEDTPSEGPKISRRDFLKIAGVTTAIGVSSVVVGERLPFLREHKIDMNNYLSRIKVEGRDEWTINFKALKTFFPDIVKESEHGGFILKNENENQVVLDFSNAGGKEIRLSPNSSKVAKSNMSWERANQEGGFDLVSGGLFLEGSFKIKGSIGNEPVFVGDVLDRVVNFSGTGSEECAVEDVVFKGLNAFKQDRTGGGDCPDPAFINGDNVNLEVKGIRIDFTPVKPDWADETNSQLAKGIILHNTINELPLRMSVSHSRIYGLQWDGICANGLTNIVVNKSRLIQHDSYKHARGVGVASTFNSPDGSILITSSTIDYCKGTSIWVNEKTELPRTIKNLDVNDTAISNAGWAISVDTNQRVSIKNLNILPDYSGGSQDSIYWPLNLNWEGNKFDLSFENLDFSLSPEMGDAIKLMFFANWDEFSDFSNLTPKDFFDKNFGSWGNISVKIAGAEFKLRKEQFKNFIDNFNSTGVKVNPSGMMLWFDVKQKQFAVMFATILDPQNGSMGFSEPFFLGRDIQNKPIHENTSIPRVIMKRLSDQGVKMA